MLDIIRRYRNGQAAHKKSVLLNSALIKLNNVLSDDARANAILEYIYDTVNQQSPSLGRVINAFGQCNSWVNFNDEMPAIGADIVVLVMQDGRVKTLPMFAVTTANIENIMQTDYPCYWVYQPSKAAQKQTPSVVTPKDFGAVGDGVTDDTKAIQAWASQTERREFTAGFYVVSKPIVFAVGGGIVGYGGQLILSDDFTGNALIVCKATKKHEQLFRAFSIDMNHKDVWLVSENESDFVVLDSFNVINTNGKWIEYNPASH